jgi:hypothetical protein
LTEALIQPGQITNSIKTRADHNVRRNQAIHTDAGPFDLENGLWLAENGEC